MSQYPPGWPGGPGTQPRTGYPSTPVDLPSGSWVGQAFHLQWAVPTVPTWGPLGFVLQRATWMSPIFDRLPGLGASQPENTDSIPLTGIEADAQLHIKVCPKSVASIQSLTEMIQVYSVEMTDPVNPDRVDRSEQREELTSDFWDGDESVTFVFEGPGRIRYWRVAIIFDLMEQGAALPSLTVQGAVY